MLKFQLFIGFLMAIFLGNSQEKLNFNAVLKSPTDQPIPAATISINKLKLNTISASDGKFKISFSATQFPFDITISSIGYKSKTLTFTDIKSFNDFIKNNSDISLEYEYELGNEVVMSASRYRERALQAPVTIQRVTAKEISFSPVSDYFGILTNQNGVDAVTSGYLFKSITTRGFNSSGNNRLNQLVDGMDNQSPGLNFAVSTIAGVTEIDVDNVELLNGASSALYGTGGTNGTLLITPKSAFKHTGLSFQIKQGWNHFESNRPGGPRPFFDWNVRWAQKVTEKFAYKIGAQYISLTDWLASDKRNYLRLPTNNNPLGMVDPLNRDRNSDPNYDGINVYGDENIGFGGTYNFDIATAIRSLLANPPAALTSSLQIPAGSFPGGIGPVTNIPIPVQIFQRLTELNVPVSRTGFTEDQIVPGNSENFKFNIGFYIKLTKKTELDLVYYYGTGSSVYTATDRFALRNFVLQQGKIELRSENWFLRGFFTAENSGNTFSVAAAASLFNNLWNVTTPQTPTADLNNILNNLTTVGGSVAWYGKGLGDAVFPAVFANGGTAYGTALGTVYLSTYLNARSSGSTVAQAQQAATTAINSSTVIQNATTAAQNSVYNLFANPATQLTLLNNARSIADAGMPTGYLNSDPRLQYIVNTPISQGGARLTEESQLRNIEFQYNFNKTLNLSKYKMEWIAGASARQTVLISNGSIFADTAGPINIYEAGAYSQVSKWFFDFWKITVSGRYDYHQNFEGRFTPRLSMVFEVARQHDIRLSVQTAYRFPTNQNQYVNFNTASGYRVIGGLQFLWDKYNLINNPGYTAESWINYSNSVYAGTPNLNLLTQYQFTPLKPESSINYELGYKGVIANRILIDAYAYYSIFSNLISNAVIVQPKGQIQDIAQNNYIYTINVNSPTDVNTIGWGLAAEYKLGYNFNIKANVYSDFINNLPKNYISFFNTSKYRFNLGFNNPGIFFKGKIGFNLLYRWQDNVFFESTFAAGEIPAYGSLDGAVNLNLLKLKSIVKLGGTNILNNYYVNGIGNPSIGGLYYLSFAYNIL